MFLAFFLALSLKNVLHFKEELAKPENQKLSFCSVVFIANIEITKKNHKGKGYRVHCNRFTALHC